MQKLVDLYDSFEEFQMNVEPSLCDKLIQCKNYIFYLADQYLLTKVVQNRLLKNITIIDVRTIILGIQAEIEVFISLLQGKDVDIFATCQY